MCQICDVYFKHITVWHSPCMSANLSLSPENNVLDGNKQMRKMNNTGKFRQSGLLANHNRWPVHSGSTSYPLDLLQPDHPNRPYLSGWTCSDTAQQKNSTIKPPNPAHLSGLSDTLKPNPYVGRMQSRLDASITCPNPLRIRIGPILTTPQNPNPNLTMDPKPWLTLTLYALLPICPPFPTLLGCRPAPPCLDPDPRRTPLIGTCMRWNRALCPPTWSSLINLHTLPGGMVVRVKLHDHPSQLVELYAIPESLSGLLQPRSIPNGLMVGVFPHPPCPAWCPKSEAWAAHCARNVARVRSRHSTQSSCPLSPTRSGWSVASWPDP